MKPLIFRTLYLHLDDVLAMEICSGHLMVLLKSPDKNGKSRYTRMVGLTAISIWLRKSMRGSSPMTYSFPVSSISVDCVQADAMAAYLYR